MTTRALNPLNPITLATVLGLAALLAWDASGLDMATARLFGSADGFPLREHPLLTRVLHDGGRIASWLLVVGLCAAIWWPVAWMRRVMIERRVQLVVVALLSVLVVSSMKALSRASCPWDLAAFGGVARHLSHWSLGQNDGGAGRCFPAGHASAGFAFVGGWFALRRDVPLVARRWLIASLLAGLVLGIGQQMRGAHFMSHTLWTGWLCWVVALIGDWLMRGRVLSGGLE